MIRNYFLIAIRHLTRHRLFSAINIFCLAIGICFSLIIGLYVIHQENVDKSLKNVDQQFLIKSKWSVKEMGLEFTTFGPLAKSLKEEYPSLVAGYYRYNPVATVVTAGNEHFKENIAIGDTTLVSMYHFPLLYGDRENAFPNINSAVITESVAERLFHHKDCINQRFSMQSTVNGDQQEYTVSAVLKNMPHNSVTGLINLDYEIFVPTIGNRFYQGGDPAQYWNGAYEIGFVQLKPGINPAQLNRPVKQLLSKYTPQNIQKNLTVEFAALRDYYLKDNNGAVQKMVTTLSLIALFILLMAIINFININIGTSQYRLKEIGLRKVFGSIQKQLIVQFIAESLLLAMIAAILSLVMYEILRPLFDSVLNTNLDAVLSFSWKQFLFLSTLVLSVGIISGIYPAFVLSSSNVINSVKGKLDNSGGGMRLRKVLLVIQFSLAIIVFISALNVSSQINYVFKKDLGYNKEQLLVLDAYPKQWDSAGVVRMEGIKEGMLQLPSVKSATLSFEIPERKPPGSIAMQPAGGQSGSQPVIISTINADQDFSKTFGLKVKQGEFFSHAGNFISGQVVLNESAVKALGLTEKSAVGTQLKLPGSNNAVLTVAGVVTDFNYSSLHDQIEPLAFIHIKDALTYRFLTLKLNTGDIGAAMNNIKAGWKKLSPTAPFSYTFMDEKFESLYKAELQLKEAADIATLLNLVIVFLGIFGIVTFTLAKRTKEIAVRKVLGADIRNIIILFLKDYLWLILLSNIIAWPIAWIISNRWLENYAYRMKLSFLPFSFVALFMFLVAAILIALQSFKAASANPAGRLRTE